MERMRVAASGDQEIRHSILLSEIISGLKRCSKRKRERKSMGQVARIQTPTTYIHKN